MAYLHEAREDQQDALARADELRFSFHGTPPNSLEALRDELETELTSAGFAFDAAQTAPRVVLNFFDRETPVAYRRRAQATFVISFMEVDELPAEPASELYPYLVRSLSNMLVAYEPGVGACFVTLEIGQFFEPEGPGFAQRVHARIEPIARSVLVINNRFDQDLEPELWDGDDLCAGLTLAGKRLAEWDLLPAPFPIDKILPPRDLRHVRLLYGVGGLSYGNLSARYDDARFWMSASGVDKSNLSCVGRDIQMVKDYDPGMNAMVLSVPREIEPRRVSVDAIEHWMIYREHPEVQAIIHVHAWMDDIPSTQFNYPCGTYQLGEAVAEKVREAPEPASAVVGLRNHGLTITGRSMEDILERVDGKLIKQIPMS
jgi:hypothetical protein